MLSLALLTALNACPVKPAEWRVWHQLQVEAVIGRDFDEGSLKRAEASLAECPPLPKIASCLTNFSRFVWALNLGKKPGHSMALPISDVDYFKNVPYEGMLDVQKELSDPELVKSIDDGVEKMLAKIEAINRKIA